MTPLQGQQDEHPEGVNRAENHHYILHGQQTQMTDVIIIKLLVTEIEKKYKMNYTKTHQSKMKIISAI